PESEVGGGVAPPCATGPAQGGAGDPGDPPAGPGSPSPAPSREAAPEDAGGLVVLPVSVSRAAAAASWSQSRTAAHRAPNTSARSRRSVMADTSATSSSTSSRCG